MGNTNKSKKSLTTKDVFRRDVYANYNNDTLEGRGVGRAEGAEQKETFDYEVKEFSRRRFKDKNDDKSEVTKQSQSNKDASILTTLIDIQKIEGKWSYSGYESLNNKGELAQFINNNYKQLLTDLISIFSNLEGVKKEDFNDSSVYFPCLDNFKFGFRCK